MIRSSRIPPLLDKICTDGIRLSLLISKDGELLGSSTAQKQHSQHTQHSQAAATEDATPITQPPQPSPSWSSMNPSDIGALIAEVVEDYKRLGCELSLLDPAFYVAGGAVGAGPGPGSTSDSSTSRNGTNTNLNVHGNVDMNMVGENHNHGSKSQQLQQQSSSVNNNELQIQSSHVMEGGGKNKNASSSTGVGGTDLTAKMKEGNGIQRDRGRFHCLIMELDMGLIGITSVTSTTYLIALAEITTQHGMMKEKLTVLANLFQDNLEMVR